MALSAFGTLGDRFDESARRTARQGLALDLKFAVTDMNGWQTAYGYGGGRSRERFLAAARAAAAAEDVGDARRNARHELVAVAIGAGVVIVPLLITAQDVVRLALERRGEREPA